MRTIVYLYLYLYMYIYCIYWRQAGHKDNSVSLAGPQTGGQLGPVSALGTVTSNFATIFGSNVKSHVFCNKNQCHFGQRVQNINLRLLQIKIWAQVKISFCLECPWQILVVEMGLGVPESVLVEYQVRKYHGFVMIHVYLFREWLIHDWQIELYRMLLLVSTRVEMEWSLQRYFSSQMYKKGYRAKKG